jgi:hypothetical protein
MLSVVGMVYNGLHDLTHDQLRDKFLYAEVTLVAEPENPYDVEAVAVFIGGHKVGHIPRRETHHVHNHNLCALKWGVASVGRNAYQSIYMTLQPWADAVRRRMGTFERGDVLELVYGAGSTSGVARLVSYVRAGDKTFYALTEQGGLRQFRYEKVTALVNVSGAFREE